MRCIYNVECVCIRLPQSEWSESTTKYSYTLNTNMENKLTIKIDRRGKKEFHDVDVYTQKAKNLEQFLLFLSFTRWSSPTRGSS